MRRRKLLLIEPGLEKRVALQQVFIGKGWEVVMAASQSDGLALLQDYCPQWVIVAATLPDGDAGAVISRVRETRRARVAVLMGAADGLGLARTAGWKPSLLLPHPLDPEEAYRKCAGEDDHSAALG